MLNNNYRYIPHIDKVNWNIKTATKGEREKIKSNLVVGITYDEKEYQAVISYLHMKYPDLMDKNPEGMNLQWHYSPRKNKLNVSQTENKNIDMYAFCIYDKSRDMEPVSFGGSYFSLVSIIDPDSIDNKFKLNAYGKKDDNGKYMARGNGYVLFVDPDYRRMGIASDQWTMESELYRNLGVKWQYDIQNENSLKVTQSLFADPNSCKIVAPGRLKNDGTRAGIRILMDYFDQELINKWNSLESNMKDFNHPFDWTFLERENLTIDKLIEPWNK